MKKLQESQLLHNYKSNNITKDEFTAGVLSLLNSIENFREFEKWIDINKIDCRVELIELALLSDTEFEIGYEKEMEVISPLNYDIKKGMYPYTSQQYFWEECSRRYNAEQINQIELLLSDEVQELSLICDFHSGNIELMFRYIESVPHKLRTSYKSDTFDSLYFGNDY